MLKMPLATVFVISFLLPGCMPAPTIKDVELRDRVIACGAGFSDDMVGSLKAAYHESSLAGELLGGFKERAYAIIFNRLPPAERLKAYEDYVKCIETPFN